MRRNDTNVDRRDLLKGAAGASVVLAAGCISTTDDEGDDGGDGGGGDDGTGSDNGDGGSDEVYQIGMVDALTGSLADFGERNQRGKDLALAEINEVGVGGRELDIVVEDSEGNGQGGVAAAQKLVNQDGVPFLIGAVGSGVSLSIYESVIQGTDVVQLSQNSTGLALSDFPGLLRMSPSGRSQSAALADIVLEDGYDEVAVTYINDEFGESLTDAFTDAYEGEVAFERAHDGEQSSYSGLLSDMNGSGADAWLFITYQQEFATQVNNM